MYKNFKVTEEEKEQIMEMHKSHGYKKPMNESVEPDPRMAPKGTRMCELTTEQITLAQQRFNIPASGKIDKAFQHILSSYYKM